MKDFASSNGSAGRAGGEDWSKEAQMYASHYNGKNETELVRDIFSRAAEGKRNGTLTNEQIDAFFAQFAPMLDSAKKKKLQKLVNQLKNM